MKLLAATALMILGFSQSAIAQGPAKADPRAVEACKKSSAAFTEIAKCLPDADVAVVVLDEFERLYSPAAQPLKEKCIEINDNISGASTCVISAVESAISLQKSLPEGTEIGDPIFDAVSSDEMYAKLLDAQSVAREKYPDIRMWGGNFYKSYR